MNSPCPMFALVSREDRAIRYLRLVEWPSLLFQIAYQLIQDRFRVLSLPQFSCVFHRFCGREPHSLFWVSRRPDAAIRVRSNTGASEHASVNAAGANQR